jgi:UDP-N-acetylmuramate: L-alanyl-gamma-D-glutamyl-meso-diaminopimelate ligase
LNDRYDLDTLRNAKRIHILGIAGTAMGTFAGMLKARGLDVRGSDAAAYPPMSDQLAAQGIPLMLGYAPENLDWGPDFVIVGNVIRQVNPEATAMRERGLPHASFPEAFGHLFLQDRRPIVVTGTHGKTTTTSLIAWLLEHGGKRPGLFVGGVPLNFGRSFRLGDGTPFVVEGDEYDTAYFDKAPKFLHYAPQVGVITNIEFDHADIFANVEVIEGWFERFAKLLPPGGRLVVHGTDARAGRAAASAACPVETYGRGPALRAAGLEAPTWRAEDVSLNGDGATFRLWAGDRDLGVFQSPLPGLHNVDNAVAALAVVLGDGLSADMAREGLGLFKSVKKRQEIKGIVHGITVIDDFAHHPTAVRETVSAISARYVRQPGARLFCCFEVESNTSRRRVFQDDYPPAFAGATAVLFCKPLDKPDNLPEEARLQLPEVVRSLESMGIEAQLIPEVDDIVAWLVPRLRDGDVVLGMSGRHFHGFHDRLLAALQARFEPH